MNPELLSWRESFGWLALQVTLLLLLAAGAQRLLRSAGWRRALWQVALVSVALLALAEWSGTGRGLAQWTKSQFPSVAPTPTSIPTKSFLDSTPLPLVSEPVSMVESVSFPSELFNSQPSVPAFETEVAQPASTSWLMWTWLAGILFVVARYGALNLFFQIFRWRRAQPVSIELTERVQRLAHQLGIRRQVRVQAFAGLAGPVAFGMWQPGIGVPMNYTEQFSSAEQDAMLAHELAHLSAHDPAWAWFTEIVTALLWWHPLVWYARRELRIVSEAAADEASALLEHGPQTLAECLVQLGGKLVASPTYGGIGMAGHGLRSGLGQRVERLLALQGKSWRPLNRWRAAAVRLSAVAALLLVATLCTAYVSPQSVVTSSTVGDSLKQSWGDSALAQFLSTLSERDIPEAPAESASSHVPENSSTLLAAVSAPAADQALTATDATVTPSAVQEGVELVNFEGTALGREVMVSRTYKLKSVEDFIPALAKDLGINSSLLKAGKVMTSMEVIDDWLQSIGIEMKIPKAVFFNDRTGVLFVRATEADLEKIGQSLAKLDIETINNARASSDSPNPPANQPAVDPNPNANQNLNSNANPQNNSTTHPAPSAQTVTDVLKDPQFRTVVEALEKSEKDTQAAAAVMDLRTRTYRVEPHTIRHSLATLETATAAPKEADTIQQLHHFFTAAGLQLTPPKAFFYNTNTGIIFLRATEADLTIVESVLQLLNLQPPQITLEARYVEISDTATLEKILQSIGMTRQSPLNQDDAWSTIYGILTQGQYSPLVRTLQQTKGVDFMSAPRITTLSGRPAQIATVDVVSVVTGMTSVKAPDGTVTNSFQIATNSFGPVLNVTPYVKADGYTVQLAIQNTITEFLGYDQPEPAVQKLASNASIPLPRTRQRQMSTEVDVWDGQTVLLAGLGHEEAKPGKKPVQKSYLILLTPTITDPAGNRVHDPADKP